MNTDIKRILVDTFGRISYLFVIFFFFIYTLYLHNEVPEALKEAWSASLTFLSVLATLGAAYIASSLFNDWKEQHNKTILSNEAKTIFKEISNSFMLLAEYSIIVKSAKNCDVWQHSVQLLDSFDRIVNFNQKITKDLKYFEDLASIKSLSPLIYEYLEVIQKHQEFINNYYLNKKSRVHSQSFFNQSEELLINISSLNNNIKLILKGFILYGKPQ